jgi:hypothetical protein
MSSFAAGYLSTVREAAQPGKSETTDSPGVKTYIDALAALVPAEVMVAHGVILANATQLTTASKDSNASTRITDPAALRIAFVALTVMASGAYLAGRIVAARTKHTSVRWDYADILRALIPALAFVGWTMLQSPTAFDAWGLQWSEALRITIAVVGGLGLGLAASLLAYQVDAK